MRDYLHDEVKALRESLRQIQKDWATEVVKNEGLARELEKVKEQLAAMEDEHGCCSGADIVADRKKRVPR